MGNQLVSLKILVFTRMRKLPIRFLVNMIFLFFFLSIFSCTSRLEEKLKGEWKGSDFLFVKTEGPDLVATINGGLNQHLNSKLILNDDGTYEKRVGEYDNGSGTWLLENDHLIATSESGSEIVYKLLKVTEDELVTVHQVSLDTPNGKLVGKITLSYRK